MSPESFATLTLARIVRPWGRRGEVAAEILTDFPERLAALGRVWLAGGRSAPRDATVLSCRLHIGQAIFRFEGISSIDEAETLRGAEVQVPFSERVSLPEGRYWISDLVECAVWEEGAETLLGAVREVQQLNTPGDAPEVWALRVETGEGGELLIPLAAEICTRIDIAERRIDVRLPEGLRESNQ